MQPFGGRGWAQMLMLAVPLSPNGNSLPSQMMPCEKFGVFLTKVLLGLNIWRFGWGGEVGSVTEIQFIHKKPPDVINNSHCCFAVLPQNNSKGLGKIAAINVIHKHTQVCYLWNVIHSDQASLIICISPIFEQFVIQFPLQYIPKVSKAPI